MSQQQATDSSRGQFRQEQILDAAAACFAREGFHGTSIARISKAAGMSPGHIYHFFASKEAIIAALVERKLEESLAIFRQFENAEDLFQAMLDRVDQGLAERTDPDRAALELEILAEAARNPNVAASVRAADRVRRERLASLLARLPRSPRDADELAAVGDVVMALFEGLTARAVHHPELDRAALPSRLRAVLRGLLDG